MATAQALIDRLLKDPKDPSVGRIANDLLREFWNGYPLSPLRELLHNPDEDVFRAALFILSELAHKGRPLLDELPRLLSHPMAHARLEAVESAMTATEATQADAPIIAQVVSLLDDPEKNVRSVTRHFITVASDEKLEVGLAHLQKTAPGGAHTDGLRWLLSPGAQNAKEVITKLAAPARTDRYYALAAASRLAEADRSPLDAAHESDDAEVCDGAEQAERLVKLLARLKKIRAKEAGK
jgi:hypothetical protein